MLDEDEENFQKALALSRQEIDMEDEEADLRRAIQLSMQGKMFLSFKHLYFIEYNFTARKTTARIHWGRILLGNSAYGKGLSTSKPPW